MSTQAKFLPAHEPRVGWFELFYDLVAVAAISQGGKLLVKDSSWSSVALIYSAMSVLFLAWLLMVLNQILTTRDSTARRIALLVQMFALIVAALSVGKTGIPNYIGFPAVVLVFLTIAWIYALSLRESSAHDRAKRILLIAPLVSAGLLLISTPVILNLDAGAKAVVIPCLLLAAVLISIVPAMGPVLREVRGGLDMEYLDERFGLLIIIVLGESFINLVANLGMLGTIPNPMFFVLCFVVTYCLWWIYFATASGGRLPTSLAGLRGWILTHLLLIVSLVSVASAYTWMTLHAFADEVDGSSHEAWTPLPVLFTMVAVALLALQARGIPRSIVRVHIVAIVILLLAVVGDTFLHAGQVGWWMILASAVVIGDAIACSAIRRKYLPAT